MNKKIRLLICVSIIFSQLSPVTTLAGDTKETGPTTTTETTEPSKVIENSVSPSETTESSSEENDSTKESKETKDSSEEASDPEGVTPAGGPTPFGTTLIEGVDIDADFATLLRTEKGTTNGGGAWSGYGKSQNQLTVSDMEALKIITTEHRSLTSLKGIEYSIDLKTLECSDNQLTDLDVTNNTALKTIYSSNNKLTNLDLPNSTALKTLSLNHNQLTDLDVTNNTALESLSLYNNQLTDLDVTNNTALTNLELSNNKLTDLDVTNNTALTNLDIQDNQLTDLDVTNNTTLAGLNTNYNQLTDLDVTNNTALTNLTCIGNSIYDITSFFGLPNLSSFSVAKQTLEIDIPVIDGGNVTIDLLKTTARTGLQIGNVNVGGLPIFTKNGDKIEMSNVSYDSLAGKTISFNYDATKLTEGSSSKSSKEFSGTIRFKGRSYLENQLISSKMMIPSGEITSWTWNIINTGTIAAKNIKANLSLSPGLTIDPTSIEVDGIPGTIADIDGTNDLGSLNRDGTIQITFNTVAKGNAGDWLKITGNLDYWDDSAHRSNESTGSIQIKDDEQTFTPKNSNNMALLSTPESFRFGIGKVKNTAQTLTLQNSDYLSNTQVVSDGFYTRLRDDRAVSTGWKLSAQLSNFKDSSNNLMPNGSGTSLRMEDLSVENITDRDTPSETVNSSPVGTPSSVVTATTLVAGQTAKTLISANPGEGIETWQLRIPFDKVSLNLPANAGQSNKNYSATLTWSLDNTP